MSKFTAMSINQLRTEAKSAGFTGTNPSRKEMEDFLNAQATDSPTSVGEITPMKSTKLAKASKKTTIETVTSTDLVAKRQYTTIGKDNVAKRRSILAASAKSLIENMTTGMTQSKIFDAVCAETSSPLTATTWNDLSIVLKDFATNGIVQVEKGEKKRALWLKA